MNWAGKSVRPWRCFFGREWSGIEARGRLYLAQADAHMMERMQRNFSLGR
jgi:hypothetical protein